MLNEKIEQANKSEFSNAGSGWFKMQEGQNQMRILTEPEVIFEDYKMGICYHQCGYSGSPKYLARILDRKDNKVKLYKIPFTIFETIAGFEQDDELTFNAFPMPYDIKINAVGAGTKEVKYTVMPSLKQTPVDEATMSSLSKEKSIKEIIVAMQTKKMEEHKADGTWQKRQDELKALFDNAKSNIEVEVGDSVEYPADDINAEDIPF